jgi:ribonuclease G
MANELIINATLPETRIALLEDGEIQELHIERDSERGIVGNIYKGKVIRVLPGMQAAFVDIGLEKAAFLYVDDIFFPDMKNPLVSPALPEPAPPKPPVVITTPPSAQPAPLAAPVKGRGGRGRHAGKAEQGRNVPVLPGSPEEHARQQQEYARRMLELEQQSDGDHPPQAGKAKVTPPAQEAPASPEVLPAAVSPADLSVSPEQPQARAPQSEAEVAQPVLPAADEDDDDLAESPAVYRPEPMIDAEAWAADLRDAEEEESAGEPASEQQSTEAAGAEPAPAEAPAEPEAETTATAAPVPPVMPLEAKTPPPVGPVGVDEDDDEEVGEMPRKRRRREPVNIADLVKEGDQILVQVAKDPIGTKGARLTCHVSLPGRYLVFMPTVDHVGVSRRIEGEGERRRLKETISKIRPPKTGVIVRTASGKQTDRKLKADLDYLVATWNDIQRKFNKQRAPSPVYQDLTIVLRAIRDMFTDEVDKVIVDSKREHKAIMKFVTRFIPFMKEKVELYQGTMPIFDYYAIETEIARSLERKVWLKSGGYLVVDQAEALVAIDVNTGRYVGKKTLEETILKTNLEAVKEIAYQLRLRNCGGIIILDLIDMEKEANREKVYKALEEELKKDRARPTILKISQLGLVEMTRKRTRDSLVRSLCEPCPNCEGRGFVKNKTTITYDIMRDIEREGRVPETTAISIQCHPSVADVMLEDRRDVLENLEHETNKRITVRGNGAYHVEQYELMAHRDAKNVTWTSEERRSLMRQRIQEHQSKVLAEGRKRDQEERAKKRAEETERRKQAEAERAARRQEAIEKRRKELEERRLAAQQKRAEIEAQRAEWNAKREEILAAGGNPDEVLPPMPELPPEEPLPSEAELAGEQEGRGEGAGPDDEGGPQGGRRRRRRRGRRGRGGRDRGEPQPRHGHGHQRHGGGGGGAPRVTPVKASAGAGSGGEAHPTPARESQGPSENAESAHAGETGPSSGQAPQGAPGEGGQRDGRRRRRRGRRGGRHRRRPGGRGAEGGASSGGDASMSGPPASAAPSGDHHRKT